MPSPDPLGFSRPKEAMGTENDGKPNMWPSMAMCYPPITPSEISIILHMIRKPNSIIVLLLIQNNSFKFQNIAKTCLPPSMLSSSSIDS